MRFSKILEKAGLVVPDETEESAAEAPPADPTPYESLLNEAPPAQEPPVAPPPAPIDPGAAVTEGTPFETIYAAAGIATPVFPAERLLKLLDGLKSMDAVSQRAVVNAMDAADETWEIQDVAADARTKVEALQAFGRAQAQAANAVTQRTQAQQQALQERYDEQRELINQQIARLQQTLEQAASEHAHALAALQVENTSAREAALREHARLRAEIERLATVVTQFGTLPPVSQGETP